MSPSAAPASTGTLSPPAPHAWPLRSPCIATASPQPGLAPRAGTHGSGNMPLAEPAAMAVPQRWHPAPPGRHRLPPVGDSSRPGCHLPWLELTSGWGARGLGLSPFPPSHRLRRDFGGPQAPHAWRRAGVGSETHGVLSHHDVAVPRTGAAAAPWEGLGTIWHPAGASPHGGAEKGPLCARIRPRRFAPPSESARCR